MEPVKFGRHGQMRYQPSKVKKVAKKNRVARVEQKFCAALRNNEDLFRGGILYFAAWRVTANIDVTPVRIERIEDVTWFSRDRLGRGKFVGRR